MARRNRNKYVNIQNAAETTLLKTTKAVQIPAAVGGWNTINPLAAMPPNKAGLMQNWIPRPGYIELRGGYVPWCTGLNSNNPVESLMVYRPAGGSEKLFAATTTKIYDVSTQTSPVLSLSGLSLPARWQYVNFTPAGGTTTLVACNGANAVLNYDGSSWTGPTINNVTSANLISVCSYQRRLFFTEKNTTKVWYLGTDAISGDATALDVGPFLSLGSYVVGCETWTIDGGDSPREMLVIASNKGQLVIYMGTDPTNSATFSLVGVFDVARPLGRRPFIKLGTELCIITLEGLVPISKALPYSTGGQRAVALTLDIQPTMLSAAQNGLNMFGWEVVSFPLEALVIMNVPVLENQQQTQYVMTNIGLNWCQFTGWNANCFAVYNDSLYFGDNTGGVQLGYAGLLDNLTPIVADCQGAFNFFESPGSQKYMGLLKPYMVSDGVITPTLGVDVDFGSNSPTAPIINPTSAGGTWGVSLWGVGLWGGTTVAFDKWQGVNALGTSMAVRLKVNYGGPIGYTTTGIVASGQSVPFLQVVDFLGLIQFGGPV